ncbi:MAG: hypothetical protein ACTHLE_03580 [Agriterribacter sp.]
MNDIDKGLDLLKDTILNDKTHQDYTRVNDLRKEYLQIFTGEDLKELLRPYHTRTDDDLFEQVVAMYQSTMPEVANRLEKTFSKIFRSNRVYASVDTKNEKAKEEILDYAGKFWEGESDSGLDAYMRSRWFHLQIFDPNAFVAIEFEDVNKVTEKTAKIFPVEFSSDEAIRFSYVNGTLDWLMIKQPIKYQIVINDGTREWRDGSRFLLYLDNHIVRLTQVDAKNKITTADDQDWKNEVKKSRIAEVDNPVYLYLNRDLGERATGDSNGIVFLYKEFEHKANAVPAKRIGYALDARTNQRTCVSIFHPARARFKKELKAGSELDLSVAAHLHPQKIQFADPCDDPDCREGKKMDGTGLCSTCHGTGMKNVSTSAVDVILVRRPRPDQEWPDLTKYVHYIKPDIEVIQFLNEYVDNIAEKAMRAVFGGQAVEKKVVNKTATEMDYSMDDVYDTLAPFAKSYSAFWRFSMTMIAIYSSNKSEDLKIYHSYPNDFKMKPISLLMEERKQAQDSGAPQHIMAALDKDIEDILYADDQDTLTKLKVRSRFNPFPGKTQLEITQIILQNKTTKYNAVLYAHFNSIFQEIESDFKDSKNEKEDEDTFYLLPYAKQKEKVSEKVQALIAEIDSEETKRIAMESKFQIEGE